jgi:anti-sigma factor RsiW
MPQRKLENIYIVRTEHVQYDLMDYLTNRLDEQDHLRVSRHLQKCSDCNHEYLELSATETFLKQSRIMAPAPAAYTTSILPRVRERLAARKRSFRAYGESFTKIILPLALSVFLVVVLVRMPVESISEPAQTEGLHKAVNDLNEVEVVQAVEKEYSGFSLSPSLEVAAAGVAEHLQGDRFLKSAVSKQIENEEVSDMDFEEIISNLNREQVDKVLSGLSERNIL